MRDRNLELLRSITNRGASNGATGNVEGDGESLVGVTRDNGHVDI